jgi:hypothetical protein
MQLKPASCEYRERTLPVMKEQAIYQREQAEHKTRPSRRNAVDLFAYHLEWRDRKLLPAYRELASALHDLDADIRLVAKTLLCRALAGSRANTESGGMPKPNSQRHEHVVENQL